MPKSLWDSLVTDCIQYYYGSTMLCSDYIESVGWVLPIQTWIHTHLGQSYINTAWTMFAPMRSNGSY